MIHRPGLRATEEHNIALCITALYSFSKGSFHKNVPRSARNIVVKVCLSDFRVNGPQAFQYKTHTHTHILENTDLRDCREWHMHVFICVYVCVFVCFCAALCHSMMSKCQSSTHLLCVNLLFLFLHFSPLFLISVIIVSHNCLQFFMPHLSKSDLFL